MTKNTSCPYRKNVLCGYMEFSENHTSNVCHSCPHFSFTQHGIGEALPKENNGRIFILQAVLISAAIVAGVILVLYAVINYLRAAL